MDTPDEFQAWKLHPVTNEFVKMLQETIQTNKDHLGAGGTLSTDAQSALVMTAKAVGLIEGLKIMLDFICPEPESEESNG